MKDTVGKQAISLLQRPDNGHSVIEQMQENLTDYDKQLFECVAEGRSKYSKDFFVEVITKKEPLLENVLRNYFINRYTCPTPNYDQVVYQYHYQDELLEFLWVIPAKDACLYLKNNALQVHESERDLLNFVMQFSNGDLYRRCKKLNGENLYSNELTED